MESSRTPRIDPGERIPFMNVDTTEFDGLSRGERIRRFEVEGYVVFPRIVSADRVARLKSELADAEMTHKSYSVHQTFSVTQPQWISDAVLELIALEPMLDFLDGLLGPEVIFTRGFFQRTHPGSPGISLHTDGQPHGSNLFGYEGSCPRLVRVLYYLDDLTPERAPFRLVPRSHLSFHADASPYGRYKWHPEEVTLCLPAGSAVVIPALLFHGTHPNADSRPRELLQLGYRPAWAGPVQAVEEWDPELVARAPEASRRLLASPNTTGVAWTQEHKPKHMPTEAPGIDPSRWGTDAAD